MAFPRIPLNIGTPRLGAEIGGGEGGGGGGASGISCCILSEVYMFTLRLDCTTFEHKDPIPPPATWFPPTAPQPDPVGGQYCIRVHGEVAYSAGEQCINLAELEEEIGAEPGSLGGECPKTADFNSDYGTFWSTNHGPEIGRDCRDWSMFGMWAKMTDCDPCGENRPYWSEGDCDCGVSEYKAIDTIVCTDKCKDGGWEQAVFDSKAFKDAFTQIKRATCSSNCEQTGPTLWRAPKFKSLAELVGDLGDSGNLDPYSSQAGAVIKRWLPPINICK